MTTPSPTGTAPAAAPGVRRTGSPVNDINALARIPVPRSSSEMQFVLDSCRATAEHLAAVMDIHGIQIYKALSIGDRAREGQG
jgi:hypothetical protein